MMGEIGLTPRAKRVIELAVDEARRLNHHYIGTEHLLLGLVREGEGIAAGVSGEPGCIARESTRSGHRGAQDFVRCYDRSAEEFVRCSEHGLRWRTV